MTTFLALYRGPSIEQARLVATTVDPELVKEFARRLLTKSESTEQDGALKALQDGRRQALQIVGGGVTDE